MPSRFFSSQFKYNKKVGVKPTHYTSINEYVECVGLTPASPEAFWPPTFWPGQRPSGGKEAPSGLCLPDRTEPPAIRDSLAGRNNFDRPRGRPQVPAGCEHRAGQGVALSPSRSDKYMILSGYQVMMERPIE
jgi:hypothetical protein